LTVLNFDGWGASNKRNRPILLERDSALRVK